VFTQISLLFQNYLDWECARLTDSDVRFSVIGRRDRISDSLRRSIAQVEERTSEGASLHLRIAIDYCRLEPPLARHEADNSAKGLKMHPPDHLGEHSPRRRANHMAACQPRV
jgi:undecaprenyl diphosphate synthase